MNVYVCFYHGDFTMVDDSARAICPSCLRGALAEYAREREGEGHSDPDGYCEGDRCDEDEKMQGYTRRRDDRLGWSYGHWDDVGDG